MKQIIVGCLCFVLTGCSYLPSKIISSFDECVAAGNPVMESYPRRCNANGKSFVEDVKMVPPTEPEGVVCTMDAKMCPDGSAVGRSGPNCEFTPCPGEVAISGVVVDEPKDESVVRSPLKIKGEAPGNWFFEGVLPVELRDDSGRIIASGTVKAVGEWMSEKAVKFEGVLEFEKPKTGKGKLVLKKDNPSGLPENEGKFEVIVRY